MLKRAGLTSERCLFFGLITHDGHPVEPVRFGIAFPYFTFVGLLQFGRRRKFAKARLSAKLGNWVAALP